jgi:hypothetical protein
MSTIRLNRIAKQQRDHALRLGRVAGSAFIRWERRNLANDRDSAYHRRAWDEGHDAAFLAYRLWRVEQELMRFPPVS